jgi:hypothetical protein
VNISCKWSQLITRSVALTDIRARTTNLSYFSHLFFLVGQMAHFGVGGILCTISLALASCIHNAFKVPFEDRYFCYQAFFEHSKSNHQFPLCYQANFQTAHVIRMRRTHVLGQSRPAIAGRQPGTRQLHIPYRMTIISSIPQHAGLAQW